MIGLYRVSPLHSRIDRCAVLLRSSLRQPVSLDPSRRVDIMGQSTPILSSGGGGEPAGTSTEIIGCGGGLQAQPVTS